MKLTYIGLQFFGLINEDWNSEELFPFNLDKLYTLLGQKNHISEFLVKFFGGLQEKNQKFSWVNSYGMLAK